LAKYPVDRVLGKEFFSMLPRLLALDASFPGIILHYT